MKVSWDDIPNIWRKNNIPNHQPVILSDVARIFGTETQKNVSKSLKSLEFPPSFTRCWRNFQPKRHPQRTKWQPGNPFRSRARIMRKARMMRALEPTALTPSRTIITSRGSPRPEGGVMVGGCGHGWLGTGGKTMGRSIKI